MSVLKRIINKFRSKKEDDQPAAQFEDDNVLELIKEKFGEQENIFEAGGHRGTDTVRIAKVWPNSDIYVFEPVPKIYKKLKKRAAPFKNIHHYELALGNVVGEIEFHVSSGQSDGSSSIMKPKEHVVTHPDVYFEKTIKVKADTLDGWAEKEGVTQIDFMWLDMQGAEYDMLKASPKIFETVKILYTEVSLIETYEGVPLYSDFKQFLEENGFAVYKEYLHWEDMGNVLFVKKSLLGE